MIENAPGIYAAASIYNQAGPGGGGPIPTPGGYKEVLYLRPDSENGLSGAIANFGASRNDYKVVVPFVDFTGTQKFMIDNAVNTITLLGRANGKTSYISLRQDSNGLKALVSIQGYSTGSEVYITEGVSNILIDKTHAEIGNTSLYPGGGSISAGDCFYFWVPMAGTGTAPIKMGRMYVYDTDENLVQEWRPVEKLGGGANRFGWYDVVNDVFKASNTNGRYFVPGPYIV